MIEIWKDIQGYEGLYQVSNLGNVRSLNWRKTSTVRNLYLKPHNRGYLQVELAKNGKTRMFTVHRLVALHFVDGYHKDYVVNHKDENKTNNRSDNLEWVSFNGNVVFSVKKDSKGRCSSRWKNTTPVQQLTENGEIVKTWDSPRDVKVSLGYSDWSIKQCCEGVRKMAYGYKWRYAI